MNKQEARHYPEDWQTEQQSVHFKKRVLAWLDDCHQRFDREVERDGVERVQGGGGLNFMMRGMFSASRRNGATLVRLLPASS